MEQSQPIDGIFRYSCGHYRGPGSVEGPCVICAELMGLRRLLFFAWGGGYGDDGELQNTQAWPFIDFKRDSVGEIEQKLFVRGCLAAKHPEQE